MRVNHTTTITREDVTHRITSILYLLALSDEAPENVGALLLRLERDALALLQASRAVLEDGGTS